MPAVAMKHEKDPKTLILDEIGDLKGFIVPRNQLLVATYRRPEKTRGGIILTPGNLNEDLFQSKAGLVVKIGPDCQFDHIDVKLHDWIVLRPSDCWALEVNFVHCRLAHADQVRAVIEQPGIVW